MTNDISLYHDDIFHIPITRSKSFTVWKLRAASTLIMIF